MRLHSHFSHITTFIIVIIVAVGTFGLGLYIGFTETEPNNADQTMPMIAGLHNHQNAAVGNTIDFHPFWKSWEVLDSMHVDRDEEDAPSGQERVWSAIKGLADAYDDPYTEFFPPEEKKDWDDFHQRGEFAGVGIEIGIEQGILTVIAPLKDTPAERAGMLSGDQIVMIDDKPSAGLNINEAVRLIRGPVGEPVTLTVHRDDSSENIPITIVRGTIAIPVLNTKLVDDDSFVIELYNFTAESPFKFRDAVAEFAETGRQNLVIDLRDNPGGFLLAANSIASWFLPEGKVVLREKRSAPDENDETTTVFRSEGYDVFTDELRLAILVNEGSASASEILAGALSEHGIATLVGETTFGKGSVQEIVDVTDEVAIKVTTAKWLTPNGVSISEQGLTPDVEIALTEEDRENDRDPQLDAAIELLRNN